jgi:hypothetical protein
MLNRPNTLKHSIDHNSQLLAQRLRLLHRMRSQHNRARLFPNRNRFNDFPHEPSGGGVHAGRGLVEVDDGGGADQGHCEAELALVAAGELGGVGVGPFAEVD